MQDTILLPEGINAEDYQEMIDNNPGLSDVINTLNVFGQNSSPTEMKYLMHKLGVADDSTRFTFREFIEFVIRPYQELQGELYEIHEEWIDLIENNPEDDIIIFAPVDSWKSTIIATNYSLYLMYLTQGKVRIALISATENLSKDRLVQCRDTIENNPILNELGVRKPDSKKIKDWGELSFTVEREETGIFGSTLEAYGVGGQIQGKKFDIIIMDDVVSIQNSSTHNNRKNIEKKYKREILTRVLEVPTEPLKASRILAVCTALNKEDLNQKLSTGFDGEETSFICKKYRAIYEMSEYHEAPKFVQKQLKTGKYMVPDGDIGQKPIGLLFPERLDYESLMKKKKKSGPTAFAQNYLQMPLADEDYTINPEWIHQCFDTSLTMGPALWHEKYSRLGYTLFFVLDPAVIDSKVEAEKKDSDYWNMEARCYHPGLDMRVILDFRRDRGRKKVEMIEMMKLFYISFLYTDPNPNEITVGQQHRSILPKLYVEQVAAQRYLVQDFQAIFGATRIKGVNTTYVSKKDGFVGLPAVQYAFEQAHVIIPCGDKRSSDYAKLLEQEAINFGHNWGHDDVMDCQLINEVAIGDIKQRNLITMLDNNKFGMPNRGPRNLRNVPTPRQRYASRRR